MTKHFGFALTALMMMTAPMLAQDAKTVVATVNGTEITLGHIIVLRQKLPAEVQGLSDDVLFKGILDQLIQQEALKQSMGDVSALNTLAIENDNRAFLAEQVAQDVISAAVTDAALQAAYDAKFANMPPATEYNAAHILVATKEEAEKIKAEIVAGADFGEKAKEFSSDGAAANGGDLGWFGLGMMVKPFEDAVVAMKAGEVAGPVQTDFGFHLIKLNETRAAAKPTLDDVRDQLAAEVEQAAIAAHIKGLTDAATITRPGEGIDPAKIREDAMVGE
ncbi:MAG: peptidylprolyl isomerase [Paracoccaceae bacterium]